MNIMITGAKGFIGKHLSIVLALNKDVKLYLIDRNSSKSSLFDALSIVDVIYHLAGVNRPKDDNEFEISNVLLTQEICDTLLILNRRPKIIFSSSIQAENNTPYGNSKLNAERIIKSYCEQSGAVGVIYRLKNVFGSGCKPNYNSVIATYCYNITHGIPLYINDPLKELDICYIDDVINSFISCTIKGAYFNGCTYVENLQSYKVSLIELKELITSFTINKEVMGVERYPHILFTALYTTYLSYLDEHLYDYQLDVKYDDRGDLAEFIKSPHLGQIFISHTKPGIVRGNHYHLMKIEKFLVVSGKGLIKLRNICNNEIIEYIVSGGEYRVINIPSGYIHSIKNIGTEDMITIFYCNKLFDPIKADTISEVV